MVYQKSARGKQSSVESARERQSSVESTQERRSFVEHSGKVVFRCAYHLEEVVIWSGFPNNWPLESTNKKLTAKAYHLEMRSIKCQKDLSSNGDLVLAQWIIYQNNDMARMSPGHAVICLNKYLTPCEISFPRIEIHLYSCYPLLFIFLFTPIYFSVHRFKQVFCFNFINLSTFNYLVIQIEFV